MYALICRPFRIHVFFRSLHTVGLSNQMLNHFEEQSHAGLFQRGCSYSFMPTLDIVPMSWLCSLQDLDDVVGAALEFYDERKLLQNNSLPLALEKDRDNRLIASPLKFPGKLAVDVQNNRLFISDSNHNRIVSICSLTLNIYFSIPMIVMNIFVLDWYTPFLKTIWH